jgi:hypothetical protein
LSLVRRLNRFHRRVRGEGRMNRFTRLSPCQLDKMGQVLSLRETPEQIVPVVGADMFRGEGQAHRQRTVEAAGTSEHFNAVFGHRQTFHYLSVGVGRVGQSRVHQAQGVGAVLLSHPEKQVGMRHPADLLQAWEAGLFSRQRPLGALRVPRNLWDHSTAPPRFVQVLARLFLARRASSNEAAESHSPVVHAVSTSVSFQHLSCLRTPTFGDQQAAEGEESNSIICAIEEVAQQGKGLVGTVEQPQHPSQLDAVGPVVWIKDGRLAQQRLRFSKSAALDPGQSKVVVCGLVRRNAT